MDKRKSEVFEMGELGNLVNKIVGKRHMIHAEVMDDGKLSLEVNMTGEEILSVIYELMNNTPIPNEEILLALLHESTKGEI